MVARTVTVKIAPIVTRIEGVEDTLKDVQKMLKAITTRLNVAPDSPELEALTVGLASDPIADLQKTALARNINPLVFPENRKAIEKVFAKRGWREGDTVEKVLREAKGA